VPENLDFNGAEIFFNDINEGQHGQAEGYGRCKQNIKGKIIHEMGKHFIILICLRFLKGCPHNSCCDCTGIELRAGADV